MTIHTQSCQEIEAGVIEQANSDPSFRRRLVDDPKAALADFLGMSLPPGITITVLEEQPGQHYLILPPAPPALNALPLDDLELALVGGGRTLRPSQTECKTSDTVRVRYVTRGSC